jgi:hypothetical protein
MRTARQLCTHLLSRGVGEKFTSLFKHVGIVVPVPHNRMSFVAGMLPAYLTDRLLFHESCFDRG